MTVDSEVYLDLVEIRRRLDALEAAVARLAGGAELLAPPAPPAPPANGVDPDVMEIARKEGMVRAIWVLRNRTGLDLAHAKARLDAALRASGDT